MLALCLILTALSAYLLGAINGSIIMSKNIFKKDIREFGSKNAGLTNAHRVFGTTGAVIVLVIDIGKTALSVLIGWLLLGAFGHPMAGKTFACFFAILGHVFPVYYGFRGGRGVLSCGVSALLIDWPTGLICWGVFILIVIITRYVSLGSITAAVVFPVMIGIFHGWELETILIIMCSLLLIIKHRENIMRLIARKESKLEFKRGRTR